MASFTDLKTLARVIYQLLRADNDVIIGCSGMTGIGKSTLLIQLLKRYCKEAGIKWSMDYITWSRLELMTWIDGDKKDNSPPVNDLKKGQMPRYSAILLDELFTLFYKRLWYESNQINSIGVLNMCRDRRLLIAGNMPNFWDLDGGFLSRIRFYFYVPARGIAWIFEQENTPFSKDKWNQKLNRHIFMKNKTPFKCPNFVTEIRFDDLTPTEKTAYLNIRNTKRLTAMDDNKDQKEKYKDIKDQRDKVLRLVYKTHKDYRRINPVKVDKLTIKDLAELTGLSYEGVRIIIEGR